MQKLTELADLLLPYILQLADNRSGSGGAIGGSTQNANDQLGDIKINGTGGIDAHPSADLRTWTVDGSAINNPTHIITALNVDNIDAPYIRGSVSVANYYEASTTSITWEVRRDGPDGQLLQTLTGIGHDVVTESSIFKGGTYANPLMLVNAAGDIWIGVTATNSNARTSEQTSELVAGHNLGALRFVVDGTQAINMSILAHFQTYITWEMGDSTTYITNATDTGSGFLNTISHTYASAGPYTVKITVPLRYIRALTAENCGITSDIGDFIFERNGVDIGWRGAAQIQTIQLRNNSIGGDLPTKVWADLEALDLIDVRGNLLTGPLPAVWSQSNSITRIFCSDNPTMAGILPPEWGNMPQLTAIDCGNCGLVGQIPYSIAQAVNLNRFVVRSNDMDGPLPESFKIFSNMDIFDISGNAFTGSLPASWSTWTDVRWIFANNNQLTGVVPASWSVMNDLERVRLYNNLLTGTAGSITSVPQMVEYEIQNNQIPVADIDSLLSAIDTTSGFTQGSFKSEGQVPAAPPTGGAANANVVSLNNKTWTVTHD